MKIKLTDLEISSFVTRVRTQKVYAGVGYTTECTNGGGDECHHIDSVGDTCITGMGGEGTCATING